MGVCPREPAMLGRVCGLALVSLSSLLILLGSVSVSARSSRHSRLSLWIDKAQIRELVGPEIAGDIPIISEGTVVELIRYPGLSESMVIPPEVDSVNLTWRAGNENFKYWFENLTSLDTTVLYNPLLSIPTQGWIPHAQTVFQMSIPCTGKEKGVASLLLGLRIFNNKSGHALAGTPISFTLKKQCDAFALCNPICQNNGTCISPEKCACPEGYHGNYCEKAVCGRPCENDGRCLPEGYCWCRKGFYGDSCEFSHCSNAPCKNGGSCIGPARCSCLANFSGNQCHISNSRSDTERPRRSDDQRRRSADKRHPKRKKKRRKRKDRKERRADLEKKLLKTEKRILKIVSRKSKAWSLTKEERRVCRKLLRDSQTRILLMKERILLSKIMTRERSKLKNKEKKKLRRYKTLIKLERRRKPKPKKKTIYV